jgi:hypothetical protein
VYDQPIPLLDLKAQYAPIREEIRAAMDRVADAQYFIGGPEVEGWKSESRSLFQAPPSASASHRAPTP